MNAQCLSSRSPFEMLTSTDPCKGGLQSLEHFHSLPEFNTEVHDGVAIGVNSEMMYDYDYVIIFRMTKPLRSLFPISLSLSLCVCLHFERLRQRLVQTIARYIEAETLNFISVCIYIYTLYIYIYGTGPRAPPHPPPMVMVPSPRPPLWEGGGIYSPI